MVRQSASEDLKLVFEAASESLENRDRLQRLKEQLEKDR